MTNGIYLFKSSEADDLQVAVAAQTSTKAINIALRAFFMDGYDVSQESLEMDFRGESESFMQGIILNWEKLLCHDLIDNYVGQCRYCGEERTIEKWHGITGCTECLEKRTVEFDTEIVDDKLTFPKRSVSGGRVFTVLNYGSRNFARIYGNKGAYCDRCLEKMCDEMDDEKLRNAMMSEPREDGKCIMCCSDVKNDEHD